MSDKKEVEPVTNPVPDVVESGLVRTVGWDPKLSPEQSAHLHKYFQTQRAGPIATLPLICRWNDCIYRCSCPLYQAKVDPPPLNLPCPVEATNIDLLINALAREMEIGPDDVTDQSILRELVMWTTLEKRAQEELALDPKTIREAVVGFDDEGEPLMKEMMNPAINMLEKAGKMKHKLREALIATREAKSRDKSRKQTTMSEVAARVAQKIAAAKSRQIMKNLPVVIDVEPLPSLPAPVQSMPVLVEELPDLAESAFEG